MDMGTNTVRELTDSELDTVGGGFGIGDITGLLGSVGKLGGSLLGDLNGFLGAVGKDVGGFLGGLFGGLGK